MKELLARMSAAKLGDASSSPAVDELPDRQPSVEERLGNQEEVQRLLGGLQGTEAQVVRLYHLEGKSYQEISAVVGMPENSIGPILTPRPPPHAPLCRRRLGRELNRGRAGQGGGIIPTPSSFILPPAASRLATRSASIMLPVSA